MRLLINISDKDAEELSEITGNQNPVFAIEQSIKFTLLHDKDSVQEALKQ